MKWREVYRASWGSQAKLLTERGVGHTVILVVMLSAADNGSGPSDHQPEKEQKQGFERSLGSKFAPAVFVSVFISPRDDAFISSNK